MKLAVVGWAGDSGVGRELINAVRHLPVTCAFILENQFKKTRKDLLTGTPCRFATSEDLPRQMELFIERHKPDTILSWELPGHWSFPGIWAGQGLKWVNMVHWDWFSVDPVHMQAWKTAKLLAPNRMCQDGLQNLGLNSTLLPVPVDTQKLSFRGRGRVETFISIYGYGGPHDRRSIPEILEAWRRLKNPPKLVIKAQKPVTEIKGDPPEGITVEIGNLKEPEDLYLQGDVALQPSRYEGVGVSMIEAQARGMPVIVVDAPPMNEVVYGPHIPVAQVLQLKILSKAVPSYVPSVDGIVDAVSRLQGSDISELSRQVHKWVEERFSWNVLRDKWIQTLSG